MAEAAHGYFYGKLEQVTGNNELSAPKQGTMMHGRTPYRYTVQVEAASDTTAGSLSVLAKVPGANDFQDIGGSIDLTAPTPQTFNGVFEALRFEPDGSFDGSDYSVYAVAVPS